jgi:hypothetical protein
MTRQHRNQRAHRALWNAIDGAIRDAALQHPEIRIPDRWRPSVVKRVVGSVLALEARAVSPSAAATGEGHPVPQADRPGSAAPAEQGRRISSAAPARR